ncbi:MAG: hypothetical protein C0623_09900 [Desulfuromonas sp.]|nr:MAG: hypothetical protein C0623_09900 [Desulfuromonas sp.]
MNKFIKYLFKARGYEVRRLPRATSQKGIEWLSLQNFNIKTVLDVGASNGCWSKECMDFFPEADYVLFEPQPVHGEALDSFNSQYKNTTIVKKAVGPSEGITFFHAADPFGGALSAKKTDVTIEVDMTSIDSSVSKLQCEEPFLLKLDTHGYEKSILEGASKTLERTTALIIEAYNYKFTDEALLFWELCAFLADKGFRVIDLVDICHRKYDNSLWQMDLFFIRDSWEGFNYVSFD